MKLAIIIYGAPIEPDVMEIIEGLGLDSYTKFQEALGKGKASGPHLGTHVWPGTNSVIMIVLNEEQATALADALKPLKERFSHEGLKLYFLPAEEAI